MTFPILGGNGAVAGYSIDNSLRFNSADQPSLTKTFASAGNRKTFTLSCWVKRGKLDSTEDHILSAGSSNDDSIFFNSSHYFRYIFNVGGTEYQLLSNQVFRDVSAWYHLVVITDTTQSTATDRIKVYVNGNQITSFQTDNRSSLSQNHDMEFTNSVAHCIGDREQFRPNTGNCFDGYIAEFNFIDGQALSPTDFGEFDEDSGIWKPKEYEGTYGTNGFYLDFEDSAALGDDVSGNGNDFTPTNLASTDQTTDTPTNNFCTYNPLFKDTNAVLSEGNLKLTNTTNGTVGARSTMAMTSGKYYCEWVVTIAGGNWPRAGINRTYTSAYGGTGVHPETWFDMQTGASNNRGVSGPSFSAFSTGDIGMLAFDCSSGSIYLGKNGTWLNSGDPVSGTGYFFTGLTDGPFYFGSVQFHATNVMNWNFGNPAFSISSGNTDDNGYGNFEYAPPTGFLALCTQNLATELSPTIDDGSEYFNTLLRNGTGASVTSITGVGFQPDFIWQKRRNSASSHHLTDSSRGATKLLYSELTNAEDTNANFVQSIDSDGFTMGSADWGISDTAVAWNWKANGGTTSSNTDGSITSTVQANTTAGFSIVTYTGTGANATIGHSLGKVPKMIIVKRRNSTSNWGGYHESIGNTSTIKLNSSDASASNIVFWNNTSPTSSVFTVGTSTDLNASGGTYVAYCFAEIEGYSKFGSYTGNGSTDGTFVYTGFRPAFVIIKTYTNAVSWVMLDNKRNTYNAVEKFLYPDLSNAEGTLLNIDYLSNGFKLRTTSTLANASGYGYIYMCFASNPLVSSTGIPVTAR